MRYRIAGSLLTLLVALVAAADDPNVARGVSAAGRAYSVHDVDAIGQFNGHLTVRIPIGAAYPVGPLLSAQLVLTNNSAVWDYRFETRQNPACPDGTRPGDDAPNRKHHAIPETYSNAGFGWLLSMGQLVPQNEEHAWFYRGPDGSQHDFDTSSSDPLIAYTKDGSFLRLKRFPADTSQAIDHREIEFPNGAVHSFASDGKLTQIRDRFGHWIRVDYSQSNKWIITHGYDLSNPPTFRTITVNYIARQHPDGAPYSEANFQNVVGSVVVPTFGDNTATYTFHYADTSISYDGCGDFITNDGCNPVDGSTFWAPLLTRVDFPDGSTYEPSYYESSNVSCATGSLRSLKLPTGGTIQWDLGTYRLPTEDCDFEHPWYTNYPGVKARRVLDRDGVTKLEEVTYEPSLNTHFGSNVNCLDGLQSFGPPPDELKLVTTNTITHEKTTTYFSARQNGGTFTLPLANLVSEYGLPMSREQTATASGARYMSSEVADCVSACTTVRRKYLTYDTSSCSSLNTTGDHCGPRLIGERTVWPLDTSCSSAACFVDVDRPAGDYDGFGHLQKSVMSGNFPGGVIRTAYQHLTPQTGNAWLLNLFDYSWSQQGSVTTRQEFAFDTSKGVLKSARTMKKTATSGEIAHDDHDLLSVICRNARGLVTSERYFGGDSQVVPSDADPCASTASTPTYGIDHKYTFYPTGAPGDAGAPKTHTANYQGMTFNTVDESFDQKTSLVSSSRDIAGVETTFGYDSLGRPDSVKPAGLGWTKYSYASGSAAGPASVRAAVRPNGTTETATPLTDSYAYFDGAGRVIMQKHKMPDGWSTVKTTYDAKGQPATVSAPQYTTSSSYADFAPAHSTQYARDVLGRVVKITAPDGKETNIAYQNTSTTAPSGIGGRFVERTVQVAQANGLADTMTREEYDAFGQLVEITDAKSVKTKYAYDLAGRLSTVCINTAATTCQQRSFDYDGRGFLTKEVHPENGTTTYDGFDARGHPGRKLLGTSSSPFDLKYVYDSAERLQTVHQILARTPESTQPLKEFTFGAEADTTNYTLGRLITAVRHNYENSTDVKVTEEYTYFNHGLVKEKTTKIESGSTLLQSFRQPYQYTDLALLSPLTYPTCNATDTRPCGGGGGLSTISPNYTNGLLTQVPSFATGITYAATGMPVSIAHAGATNATMTDTITPDSSGMPRPVRIKFDTYDSCARPAIVQQPQDQSIQSGSAQLSVVASTGSTTPLTYEWFVVGSTAPIASCTTASCIVTPAVTTRYTVRIINSCGAIDSAQATVTVCGSPTVSVSPAFTTGSPVTLTATASGCSPLSYQWYIGPTGDTSTPTGTNSATFSTGTLTATRKYWVRVTDGTGGPASSNTAKVAVPLPAPATLTATVSTQTSTSINLSWAASPGADHYQYQRRTGGGSWSQTINVTPGSVAVTESSLLPNTTYVYRLWAVDADGESASEFAPLDLATTRSYVSIQSGGGIRFSDIDHVLSVVNNVRGASGQSALTWSQALANAGFSTTPVPAQNGLIFGNHLLALRAAMDSALQGAGMPRPAYTDSLSTPTVIKAVHLRELQQRAQ